MNDHNFRRVVTADGEEQEGVQSVRAWSGLWGQDYSIPRYG